MIAYIMAKANGAHGDIADYVLGGVDRDESQEVAIHRAEALLTQAVLRSKEKGRVI